MGSGNCYGHKRLVNVKYTHKLLKSFNDIYKHKEKNC